MGKDTKEESLSLKDLLGHVKQGGIHFSTEQGRFGGKPIAPEKVMEAVKKAGGHIIAHEGAYKDKQGNTSTESSFFVPNPSPKVKAVIASLAKQSGQEAILINSPLTGKEKNKASLLFTNGPSAGKQEHIGEGMSVTDQPPQEGAYTKFNTASGPKYITIGTGEVPVAHYGKPGLTELDPQFAESGTDRSKAAKKGPRSTKFQASYGLNSDVEPLVTQMSGNTHYVTNIKPENYYDMGQDPKKYMSQAAQMIREGTAPDNVRDADDLAHMLAQQAGHEGVQWEMGHEDNKIYHHFNKKPVVMAEGGRVQYAEGTPDALVATPEAQAPVAEAAPQESQQALPQDATHIYDISGKEPVLGTISHEEVEPAVKSGKFSMPQGKVNVVSPDGIQGTVEAHELRQALNEGYTYATPSVLAKRAKEEKYGTPEQIAITALEGAGEGVAGFVAPMIERGLGVDAEDIANREEVNPWWHRGGEAVAFGGSLLGGVGLAPALTKAGELVATTTKVAQGLQEAEKALQIAQKTGIGLEEAKTAYESVKSAATVLDRAKLGAVKLGTEMAALQASDEVAQHMKGTGNSVGTALVDIGGAGLFGMLTGGTFSAAAAGIGKLSRKLELQEIADRLRVRWSGENPDAGVAKEYADAMDLFHDINHESYGPKGLRSEIVKQNLPVLSETMMNEAQVISSKAEEAFTKMQTEGVPRRLRNKAERAFTEFQEIATKPEASAEELFNATNNYKTKMQSLLDDEGAFVVGHKPDSDFIKINKDLVKYVQKSLENPETWGKVGDLQKDLNSAFSQAIRAVEDSRSKFMQKVQGKWTVDPAKFNTYLKENGRITDTSIRQMKMGNFVEAMENYQKTIEDVYKRFGLENPHNIVSLGELKSSLGKVPESHKIADAIADKYAAQAIGSAAGATAGGALGQATGIPGLSWIMAVLGGKAGEKILPSIIQPFLEKIVNAKSFDKAAQFADASMKGQKLISKSAKGLFNNEASFIKSPSPKELEKLEKYIKSANKSPESLIKNDDLAHYMPEHNTEVAATAGRIAQYLEKISPKNAPTGLLDTRQAVSKIDQAAYDRQLQIVQNPAIVFNHIKSGTLLPQDVATLSIISPELYENMKRVVFQELSAHVEKGESVPYSTRMSLSLFLEQPLDSTMTPTSIMAAQMKPQQAMPQQAAGQGKGKSMKSLGKAEKMTQTSTQQAEKDRASRD